jgi:hypothetical protein
MRISHKRRAQEILNAKLADVRGRRVGPKEEITFSALLTNFEELELPNLSPGGADSYRAAGLRVLKERVVDARTERICLSDNGFRVIRNEHVENAGIELPRFLAGFDRRFGRLAEHGPDKAETREDRRENPGTKATEFAEEIGLQ